MEEIVFNGSGPQLLREYLRQKYPLLSAGDISRGLQKKAVRVNRQKAGYNTRLQPGDTVQLYLPAALLCPPAPSLPFLAAREDLAVVYEDDGLLVVNKPAGLLCVDDQAADTALARCCQYLYKKGLYQPGSPPQLCHRLDRGTSGLLMVAKTPAALAEVRRQMDCHAIQKTYVCIVVGQPTPPQATLRAYLTKNSAAAAVRISPQPLAGQRSLPIETRYRLLSSNRGLSLLEIDLVTGRTHQIRAHMASIGCPVLGDGKYGDNRLNRLHKAKYQALCARRLRFSFTGQESPVLAGLAGKTLQAPAPWFETAFYSGTL